MTSVDATNRQRAVRTQQYSEIMSCCSRAGLLPTLILGHQPLYPPRNHEVATMVVVSAICATFLPAPRRDPPPGGLLKKRPTWHTTSASDRRFDSPYKDEFVFIKRRLESTYYRTSYSAINSIQAQVAARRRGKQNAEPFSR